MGTRYTSQGGENVKPSRISDKKAIEAAETIVEYCKEQGHCQNCIFRLFGCENWHCAIGAFEIQGVLNNREVKKKHHGYID